MDVNADTDTLQKLAALIQRRNELEKEISAIIQRPVALSSLGEYIATRIFPIRLIKNAAHPAIDGYFYAGPLTSCSVNIKWYAMREGTLDITPGFLPDYYLILAGPLPSMTAQLGLRSRPWLISSVHLFDACALVDDLAERGLKVGPASSVRRELWDAAEIYPRPCNPLYPLNDEQRRLLELFK
ncbi:MAG: hypothetical protein QME21_19825 [Anaerolineales bacterium]|nr:hypothetical protein [Anaerolineales bacterium]